MSSATFPATKQALSDILAWIQSQTDSHTIQLVAEEVIVNIVHHAQADEVTVTFGEELTFIDTGIPFNPLEQSSHIDTDAPLDDRLPGGLGIEIIRRYTTSAEYKREDEKNVLLLRFAH